MKSQKKSEIFQHLIFLTAVVSSAFFISTEKNPVQAQNTLQSRAAFLDEFLKEKDGFYRGRLAVFKGRQRKEYNFRFYKKGDKKVFFFEKNSFKPDFVLFYGKDWSYYDVLRREKILIRGPLKKKEMQEIGFSPAVFLLNLESLYQPLNYLEKNSSAQLALKGQSDEAYKKISIRSDQKSGRPMEMDFYSDDEILLWSLRYLYRNQMESYDGKKLDLPNFADRLEWISVNSGMIFRMDYFYFDGREFDESIFDLKRILYAPQ